MKFFHSKRKKQFLNNFINYSLFQASKYIVPFITIPYIIYILGVEKFGIISLAQGVANYIRVGVDYGWNILGVQYIARAADNEDEQGRILSIILAQQLLLSCVGFVLLLIGIVLIPKYSENAWVFMAAFGLIPGNMLLVPWYFVGMQKVKFLNQSFLIARLIYVLAIVLFLKMLNGMIWVPLFNSISLLLAGFINIYIIKYKFGIKFYMPRIGDIKRYFREGWHIFISYFSTNFYRNSNVIILGFFTNNYFIGVYSLAEKVIKVIQGTFMPLSQTLFPYIAKFSVESIDEAIPAIKKVSYFMGAISFITVLFLMIFAPWIILLLLKKNSPDAVYLLRIGSSVIFFGVMNFVIGVLFMTNFGMKKQFSNSVIWTGAIGISLSFILSYIFKAEGAMYSFAFSEIFLFILLLVKSWRYLSGAKNA